MTVWMLVKALLLKDLIGFVIGLAVCGTVLLGAWFAMLVDDAHSKKRWKAERRKS